MDVDGAGRQSPMDSGIHIGTPGQQMQYGSWGQSGMWPGSSGFLPSGSPQWNSPQFGPMQTMPADSFSTAPGATVVGHGASSPANQMPVGSTAMPATTASAAVF